MNIAKVAELIAQGRMQPAGLAAFERREEGKDGSSVFRVSTNTRLRRSERYGDQLTLVHSQKSVNG